MKYLNISILLEFRPKVCTTIWNFKNICGLHQSIPTKIIPKININAVKRFEEFHEATHLFINNINCT